MGEQESQVYVSIIGFNYLHPIARLLETLESLDPKGPNEVQASVEENSYSAAIIILTKSGGQVLQCYIFLHKVFFIS